MGKSSRTKGARGERELAKLWQEALPHLHVRRTGQDQAHQAEQKPGDIDVGGLPYSVEGKRRKRLSWTVIREGLEQAKQAASEGEMPVLCAREDRGQWIAVVDLEVFLHLVAEREAIGGPTYSPAPMSVEREALETCRHNWVDYVDPVSGTYDLTECSRCGEVAK